MFIKIVDGKVQIGLQYMHFLWVEYFAYTLESTSGFSLVETVVIFKNIYNPT
jgi:hypothetical protein